MEQFRQREGVEREKEHLIVEIGSGDNPYLTDITPEYRRAIAESNTRYVGIDLDEHQLVHGREFVARNDARLDVVPSDRVHFVRASAEALPFKNGVAAEVVLSNVLGDPEIEVETKQQAIHEAARILKPEGVLKIVEQYTPMQMHEDNLLDYIRELPEFEQFTKAQEDALPAQEKDSDIQQTRSIGGAELFAGFPVVARFKRRA